MRRSKVHCRSCVERLADQAAQDPAVEAARAFASPRNDCSRSAQSRSDGYDDAFSQLTNVDMKFGVLIDADGRERPLTQSTYSSFLLKRDREVRRTRVRAVLRRVSGSSIHARVVAGVFGEGGRVSRAGPQLSERARSLALQRRRAGGGLRRLDRRGAQRNPGVAPLLRIAPARAQARRAARVRHLRSARSGNRHADRF